jgi:hypothetical protein
VDAVAHKNQQPLPHAWPEVPRPQSGAFQVGTLFCIVLIMRCLCSCILCEASDSHRTVLPGVNVDNHPMFASWAATDKEALHCTSPAQRPFKLQINAALSFRAVDTPIRLAPWPVVNCCEYCYWHACVDHNACGGKICHVASHHVASDAGPRCRETRGLGRAATHP